MLDLFICNRPYHYEISVLLLRLPTDFQPKCEKDG